MNCPPGQKKSGCCGEVTVNGHHSFQNCKLSSPALRGLENDLSK